MICGRNSLLATTLAIGVVLSLTFPAYGAFTLEFSQAGGSPPPTLTVVDRVGPDGIAPDLAGSKGVIQLGMGPINTFKFGAFEVWILTGTSNSPGTTVGQLDISSVFLRNTSSEQATLTIRMTDTDFTSPEPPLKLDSLMTGQVLIGSATISFQSFADDGNTEFGTQFATPVKSASIVAAGTPIDFSLHGTNAPFNFSGTYSLSNETKFTLSAGAIINVSGGKTTLVTPEPTSMAIWAASFVGIFGLTRLRRRRA
jgi:hypothetical protein